MIALLTALGKDNLWCKKKPDYTLSAAQVILCGIFFCARLQNRRTHPDGCFSAWLCLKSLKYTKYSCTFSPSPDKKTSRHSAHFASEAAALHSPPLHRRSDTRTRVKRCHSACSEESRNHSN